MALVFSLILSFHANAGSCTSQSQAALSMCKSKSFISEADPKGNFVNTNFRPTNERMSPESCQGFSDAYSRYKNLTENYIQSCDEQIEAADMACRNINISSKSDILDVTQGIQVRDQAKDSRGHLEALKPPMDRMKKQLDDCLRETGGRIVNTNKDRGDADMTGSPELPLSREVNESGTDSAGKLSLAQNQHLGYTRQSVASASSDPNVDHKIPSLEWGSPKKSKAEIAALQAKLRAYEESRGLHGALKPNTQQALRAPASAPTAALKSRNGIMGPENNLFQKIHLRYKAQRF